MEQSIVPVCQLSRFWCTSFFCFFGSCIKMVEKMIVQDIPCIASWQIWQWQILPGGWIFSAQPQWRPKGIFHAISIFALHILRHSPSYQWTPLSCSGAVMGSDTPSTLVSKVIWLIKEGIADAIFLVLVNNKSITIFVMFRHETPHVGEPVFWVFLFLEYCGLFCFLRVCSPQGGVMGRQGEGYIWPRGGSGGQCFSTPLTPGTKMNIFKGNLAAGSRSGKKKPESAFPQFFRLFVNKQKCECEYEQQVKTQLGCKMTKFVSSPPAEVC